MNTTQNLSPALLNAITQLGAMVKPALDEIHKGHATTQNYYWDYMAILGATGNAAKARLLALGMIEAGANVLGIEAAMKILGYAD